MKKISILGSTGSIGTQALDVIRHNIDKYQVTTLSCAKSLDLLRKQIKEFRPLAVVVADPKDAKALAHEFNNIEVYYGKEGLNNIASMGA